MAIKNFSERLTELQNELRAPKSQYNSFGKYNYRKCEDILEAVKPLLHKYRMSLTISDRMVMMGNRHYVMSECRLIGWEGTDDAELSCEGWAREESEKKGMDESQITGAASSYARKYALNGLFLIDDTADSDTTNTTEKKPSQKETTKQQSSDASQPSIMDSAVNYIKTSNNKASAYEAVIKKHGDKLTDNQKAALKKFVR